MNGVLMGVVFFVVPLTILILLYLFTAGKRRP